jgi:hypothetical protein
MKFNSNIALQGNHGVKVDAKSDPITCSANGEANFKIATSPIRGHVGDIPLQLAIPFVGLRTVAAIGAFAMRIDPCNAEVQAFGVRCHGVLGAEGMECHLNGTVAGKTTADLTGTIYGKFAKMLLELANEDDVEPPSP